MLSRIKQIKMLFTIKEISLIASLSTTFHKPGLLTPEDSSGHPFSLATPPLTSLYKSKGYFI
jgi:hypothetical protein